MEACMAGTVYGGFLKESEGDQMIDREKVIKGLEVCKKNDCSNCPYNLEAGISNERVCLIDDLISDALDLLKEHEPRILDWDEVKNYSVVWCEFKGIEKLYPMIIENSADGSIESWNPNVNRNGKFLMLISDDEDMENTRCWNYEPTEEQRKEAKWG